MVGNPQLSLVGIQYLAWRTTAEAIAGTNYIFNPETGSYSPYRPKQWDKKDYDYPGTFFYLKDEEGTYYFFDAVLKSETSLERRSTDHPVQTGANISDHSFQLPVRISMEIGVSDAMDCFREDMDWQGYDVRSINAANGLKALQETGKPLTVVTRLFSIDNLIIERIVIPEDYRTVYEMRANIFFKQIPTVTVSTVKLSLTEQTTGKTEMGPLLPLDTPVRDKSFLAYLFGGNLGRNSTY